MTAVEPFSPPHEEGVIALILPIQRGEFGVAVTLEDQPDLRTIPSFYQRGAGNFWVALDAGRVIGTVGLLDIGDGQAALRKMFVAKSYRGAPNHVAERLLLTLLSWAREHQVRDIYLGTTVKYLAAHRFYEKHGFTEIHRDTLPSTFPIMRVDTKFYCHALSPADASLRRP